jgi:hypothetical protein
MGERAIVLTIDEDVGAEDNVIQVAQLRIKLADDSNVIFEIYVARDDHQMVYVEIGESFMRMEGGPNIWETFREFLPMGCNMNDFYFDSIWSYTMGAVASNSNILDMSWTLVKRHHNVVQIQMFYEHGLE